MAQALLPVALRVLPAVGGAAAGGAAYEAIEQTYRHIKNKVKNQGRPSSSRESRFRSRSEERRYEEYRKYYHASSSSRSRSRSLDSLDRDRDHRHYGSRRHRHDRERERGRVREDERYQYHRHPPHQYDKLDAQSGALVLHRQDSSDAYEYSDLDSHGRRPKSRRASPGPRPTVPPDPRSGPLPRPNISHPPHHPPPPPSSRHAHVSSDSDPDPASIPQPDTRPDWVRAGYPNESAYLPYKRALKSDSEALNRQCSHPMTAEADKRAGRRVLVERGWRPRPTTGAVYPNFPLPPSQRKALEIGSEELFSPRDLHVQARTQSQSPHYAPPPGPYDREEFVPRKMTRGQRSYTQGEKNRHAYDSRRSRSQQPRYEGRRPRK